MAQLDRNLIAWMRAHRAIVTGPLLASEGLSTDQRRRLVEGGVLERVVDGAYHFAGVETDELSRCVALCTSRPLLVVSGPTAGRIWGIRRSPRDALVHVLAPPHSQPCREPWVKAYRTSLIDAEDIVRRRDGVRITSPPRTLADLSRSLPGDALASAVESALSARLCSMAAMYCVARRLDTPGRPWARRFLAVLDGRHDGAARESDWERRVLDALVQRGVDDVTSQLPQRLPGYGPARFDLAIASLQLVIEIDVHPEHRTIEGQATDHRRDRDSRRMGWEVERVGEAELTTNFDRTIDELVGTIQRRRSAVARLHAAGLWPPGRSPSS